MWRLCVCVCVRAQASAAALKQQNEHLTAVVSQQTNKIAELSVTVSDVCSSAPD